MQWRAKLLFLYCLCGLSFRGERSSSSIVAAGEPQDFSQPLVLLELGENLGDEIPAKIRRYLAPWTRRKSSLTAGDVVKSLMDGEGLQDVIKPPVLLVALGNTTTFEALSKAPWAKPTGDGGFESYGVLSMREGPFAVIAGDGLAIDPQWKARTTVSTGASFAAYDVLQELGFLFWNPLQPIAPDMLKTVPAGPKARWEAPRWRSRAFHVHTQHPLELTDVMQGFDIPLSLTRGADAWTGLADAYDVSKPLRIGGEQQQESVEKAGCESLTSNGTYCEYWEDMLPDVGLFFEWCVAHRINRVEWILLGNRKWGPIVESTLRHRRLAVMARMAQSLGLMVGVDDPIAFQQQHSWVMTTTLGPVRRQLKAVRDRVDWILSAGFDFVSTESGLSEFSHPNDKLMLSLLNQFADRVNGTWGKEATVKVHCSTKQTCKNFVDPRTGQPLNFNFLPTYATPQLGVLPHTVQAYALDDPTANVYGNGNFSYMLDYMLWEASQGNRSVHFYPETAYWVNVDVDVPLLLPIYAERRLHDLQVLADREDGMGLRISGVLNFDSGWEWGYWLNDVIMAAASWDPRTFGTGQGAYRAALDHVFRHLEPLSIRTRLVDWLVRLTKQQYDLLLLGSVDGKPCYDQSKLSGIAYLCGTDTWVDLPRLLGLSFTQPDKVRYREYSDPRYPFVLPLLEAMKDTFASLHDEVEGIIADLQQQPEAAGPLVLDHIEELRDGAALLALRAKQVYLLYKASAQGLPQPEKEDLLLSSRQVLERASQVVVERETKYRSPLDRVSGWREGPTVYGFGYLWTVHSLYYWWRDQGVVEASTPRARFSPCYLNRMDPTEVAIGVGKQVLHKIRERATSRLPFAKWWADCLAPPKEPFEFPRDL